MSSYVTSGSGDLIGINREFQEEYIGKYKVSIRIYRPIGSSHVFSVCVPEVPSSEEELYCGNLTMMIRIPHEFIWFLTMMIRIPMNSYGFWLWWSEFLWIYMVFDYDDQNPYAFLCFLTMMIRILRSLLLGDSGAEKPPNARLAVLRQFDKGL